MSKHINVALFVPHKGCPHQCGFCNQHSISGSMKHLSAQDVDDAAITALKSGAAPETSEIAFFGGSFTAIERGYMEELLEAAARHIESGHFSGVRISTRPDCIDENILRVLKTYHVSAIELGAQSMDERVLKLNSRGHSAADTVNAVNLIKSHGIQAGLQMMTGLYGCDRDSALFTAQSFIELQPATVRIYPTVVLKDTMLEQLYKSGEYLPQTVEEAVTQCAELMLLFHKANTNVIRVGLHSGGNIDDGYIAGPYHPAFRDLCEGEIYYTLAAKEAARQKILGKAIISVKPSEISKMAGQGRRNLIRLQKDGLNCKLSGDSALDKYQLIMRITG